MVLSRFQCIGGLLCVGAMSVWGQAPNPATSDALEGTRLLTETMPLDEVMVAGIDRFALRSIDQAAEKRRTQLAGKPFGTVESRETAEGMRREFSRLIGVVDERNPPLGIELIASLDDDGIVAENEQVQVLAVRWKVLSGIDATGLLIRPINRDVLARVVAIPDADWTPEMIAGIVSLTQRQATNASSAVGADGSELDRTCNTRYALDFAMMGCEVLVPAVISRGTEFSRNDEIGRSTNLSHREFIYRQAFEMGRHVIGFEVQKILAAIDQFELRNEAADVPVIVAGVSEGGLLALYSAAIDTRIDAAIVSGYFNQRDRVWQEPIYRNVWGLLKQCGDAELAALIAPRQLYIEASPAIPEVTEPAKARRNIAAPGIIVSPKMESVLAEVKRARGLLPQELAGEVIRVVEQAGPAGSEPLPSVSVRRCLEQICSVRLEEVAHSGTLEEQRSDFQARKRQRSQINQMVDFTQQLVRKGFRARNARFAKLDRSSAEAFDRSAQAERDRIHEELFGRLPVPRMEADPRTRLVLDDHEMLGYEVVLDVYQDVIAAGILLLPKDLRKGEKRPVVVCQHGLEGVPMDTISGPESRGYRAYKSFAAELCRRGFIVYSPQNPYRGGDRFRTLQRKSNVLGRSLFSYIIPQHLVTLRWLSELPAVDPARIGFYGLSYGGKTAVRVPPMLPPTADEPGYCLSICSADYNDWVAKNASVDAPFSYLWTGEYEIFEWNMGHVANYAELSMLMTPRPFMVERGHDDGVGIDEWVAWEFAKVRRHYNKLDIGDATEIEFFNGPHTINGKGTYQFLHQHLQWPEKR